MLKICGRVAGSCLAARRATVSIRSSQSANKEEAPADAVVERLVDRRPDMFMDPAKERGAEDRTLEYSEQQAEQKGLNADGGYRPRDILGLSRGSLSSCAAR